MTHSNASSFLLLPLLLALLECSCSSAPDVFAAGSGGASEPTAGEAGHVGGSPGSGAAGLGVQSSAGAAGSEAPGPSDAGAGGAASDVLDPIIIGVTKHQITRGDSIVVHGKHFLPSRGVL